MPNNQNSLKFYLVNLTFQFSIYCYFALIPFYGSETQPYSFVFALIYISLFGTKFKWPLIIISSLVSFYFIVAFIAYIYDNSYPIGSATVSALSFIIPLIIFCTLYENINLISKNGFFITFTIWFFFGLIQNYFPELLEISGLEKIIKIFISRFEAGQLEKSGRGITFLAPEPGDSAYIIILFLVFIVYLWRTQKISYKSLIISMIMLLLMVIWNKSTTLLLLLFVIIISYSLLRFRMIYLVYIISLISILYFVSQTDDVESFRGLHVISDLFEVLSSNDIPLLDFINYTTGSVREISVIVGYGTIINGYPLGIGLGTWSTEFINESFRQGYYITDHPVFKGERGIYDMKPFSYVAAIAFDMGLVGLLGLFFFFSKFIGELLVKNIDKWGLSVSITSFFAIFFHTLVSLPAFWVTLTIGIQIIKEVQTPSNKI